MPLYNIHTFIALTVVLVFALVLERPSEIKFIVDLARNEGSPGLGRLISHPRKWPEIFRGAPIRRQAAAMLAAAVIPASFFVWLVTDHFRAASVLQWHPGWAQDSQEFAAPFFRMGGTANFGSSTMFGALLQKTWNGVIAPFFQFWLTNFGLWIPLALGLLALVGWRIWKSGWRWGDRPPADVAFVVPAVLIFAIGYFFKTAPWEWDNLKLMVWGYFLMLPFLWSDILGRGAFPERAAMCIAPDNRAPRVLRRAPGLWTHRASETRLRRRSDAAVADGRPLCCMADLQLSGLVTRPQSSGRIPRPSMDGRI